MGQHSPGPWTIHPHYPTVVVISGHCREGNWIEEHWRARLPIEESRANALLIAAAPDLLAALKEAVRLYESSGLQAQVSGCGAWVNASRDAIKKAEGPRPGRTVAETVVAELERILARLKRGE